MATMPSEINELLRNHVKEKLGRGEVVASMTVRLIRGVEIARIAKTAGFDSLYVDLEHSSFSLDTTSQICVAALERFGATRSVQDASAAARNTCQMENERLDSELAMVRFVAWAIPALGFVGTVRGIGESLQQAHRAIEGDVSGVTAGLGVSFNSTLIALTLSIVVMFFLHQLQLLQERLVLDTEQKRERAAKMGIKDPRRKYQIEDMVKGECLFAATGVTDGHMLRGVQFGRDVIETETVVMRSTSGTIRWIRAEHRQLGKFR